MELSGRVALLVFTAILASVLSHSAARAAGRADDPAAIAGDEAAFNRLRADLAKRNAGKEEARRPVQVTKNKQAAANLCQIKPVMTDAEIDACRTRR